MDLITASQMPMASQRLCTLTAIIGRTARTYAGITGVRPAQIRRVTVTDSSMFSIVQHVPIQTSSAVIEVSSMRRSMFLLGALWLVAAGLSVAQEEETIDHVTDDNVIVLQNGAAYESQDTTSTTWHENDDVIILDDEKM